MKKIHGKVERKRQIVSKHSLQFNTIGYHLIWYLIWNTNESEVETANAVITQTIFFGIRIKSASRYIVILI